MCIRDRRITVAERLNDADAFIATGSDNTARYFEYYFSKKPHIIRRNRTVSYTHLDVYKRQVFLFQIIGCQNNF